jgi:hypothetical protein
MTRICSSFSGEALMMLVVILLLFLAPNPAGAESLHLRVAVAPEAVGALPATSGLEAGIQRLFAAEFGTFTSLVFDGEQSGSQAAAASDTFAQVRLEVSGGAVTASTDFTRARATRSLVSTVPAGSPASLLATIAGDLAFLFVSSRGFSTLPLSPPPALVASLSTDTLGTLTGWNPEELEPVGLAGSGDEITICFPHRYLTLGPLFRISASTIRDINGQGIGREPMQLSGIVQGPGDTILLLSEREARIAFVDPRLGTRQVTDAQELSALPARLIGRRTLAALPGKLGEPGIRLYPLEGGPSRVVRVAASYVPAFDLDREGNLWAWDAGERRVRILTPRGQEVFSIRPLFSAATVQLPQQLAVFDDGSFLLAGSAEVWKFQSSGIPVWRLARIPGRPGESLPSSFDLAANRSSGSFTILDAQSRRLLAFSSSPAGEAARLGSLLERLDSRKLGDLQEASAFAHGAGLGLVALQYGELLILAGGAEAEREAARIALLREKAAGYSDFADGLTRDLLYERADAAWLRTAETLRELAAESPEDQAAAAMLQTVLARRREIRSALTGTPDIQVVSARVLIGHPDACGTSLTLEVTLRNSGAQALRGVRVHAGLPSAVSAPALAALDEIPPSEEREVRIPLGPADLESPTSAAAVPVFALVTYERGAQGISRSLSFSAQAAEGGPRRSLAEALACRAVPQDTLAANLAESLLEGARSDPSQPLAELAGILNSLGAARRQAHTVPGVSPADSTRTPESTGPTMRNLLRGLSPDESDWTIVTASIASTLGMPAAILSLEDRPIALVDTGIPFANALAAVPGLERFSEKLAGLSPGGTLWLPLSGRVPPSEADGAIWSLADALDAIASGDMANARRSAVAQSGAQESAPLPFPLVLPVSTARPSIAALRDAAESSLAGVR